MNDLLRRWIGLAAVILGRFLELIFEIRIARFRTVQARLRKRYRILDSTPILPYGPELEASFRRFAEGKELRWAKTSGSTQAPKLIAYTAGRIRMVKLVYMDVFLRCYARVPVERKSLYLFSALAADDSLTGMLLEEPKLVPYLSGLQAPYRAQAHPKVRELTASYGATAVRLWILAVSNPGVVYSTNPSTLSSFLDALEARWEETSKLCRELARTPERFAPIVHRIARRITSAGAQDRLQAIAAATARPPIAELFPGLEAYVTWTGGYVAPFLDRIRRHLPEDRYRLIPMYSMSTETIETIADFRDGTARFLPLAPGVLYELLPEGAPDSPEHLIPPERAEIGKTYALVASDGYGLVRYQTGDLFFVESIIDGLPDLRFMRRRALEYSFTGEKLTGDQLELAYARLRAEHPELGPGVFFSCIPSRGAGLPHYKLALISAAMVAEDLASRFDAILSDLNSEYAEKRRSKRLGPPELVQPTIAELVERVGSAQEESWESQFKLLPLYRRTWERP